MKFTIKRKELKAIQRFAADKDVRFYLMGVCVTQDQRGTIVEATNGHMLGRLRLTSEPCAPARVIIGSADVDKLKGTKKTAEDWLHFTVDGQKIEVITPDATMTFTAMDGRFPDTDRVTPVVYDGTETTPAHFNPEYLMAFMDASADLTGKKQIPRVIQRGENSAVVLLPAVDEFVGVLMPVREAHMSADIPRWIYRHAESSPETVPPIESDTVAE